MAYNKVDDSYALLWCELKWSLDSNFSSQNNFIIRYMKIQFLLFKKRILKLGKPIFHSQKELAIEICKLKGSSYFGKSSKSIQAFLSQIFKKKRPIPEELHDLIIEIVNQKEIDQESLIQIHDAFKELLELPQHYTDQISKTPSITEEVLHTEVDNKFASIISEYDKIIILTEKFDPSINATLFKPIIREIIRALSSSNTKKCFELFFGNRLSGISFWLAFYENLIKRISEEQSAEIINTLNFSEQKILSVYIIDPKFTVDSRIIFESQKQRKQIGFLYNSNHESYKDLVRNGNEMLDLAPWFKHVYDPIKNEIESGINKALKLSHIIPNRENTLIESVLENASNFSNSHIIEKEKIKPDEAKIITLGQSRFEKELLAFTSYDNKTQYKLACVDSELYDASIPKFADHKGFAKKFNIEFEYKKYKDYRDSIEILDANEGESICMMPRETVPIEYLNKSTDIVITNLFRGFELVAHPDSVFPKIESHPSREYFEFFLYQLEKNKPLFYALDSKGTDFISKILKPLAKQLFKYQIQNKFQEVDSNYELVEPIANKVDSISVCTGPVLARALNNGYKRLLNIQSLENFLEKNPKEQYDKWLNEVRHFCLHQSVNINVPPEKRNEPEFKDKIERISKLFYYTVDYIEANHIEFVDFLINEEQTRGNKISRVSIASAFNESYLYVPMELQGSFFFGKSSMYPIEESMKDSGRHWINQSFSSEIWTQFQREKTKLSKYLAQLTDLMNIIDGSNVEMELLKNTKILQFATKKSIQEYSFNPNLYLLLEKTSEKLSKVI